MLLVLLMIAALDDDVVQLEGQRQTAKLVALLKTPRLRPRVLRALGRVGDEPAVGALLSALGGEDQDAVVSALGLAQSERASAPLWALLAKTVDADKRANVLRALGRTTSAEDAPRFAAQACSAEGLVALGTAAARGVTAEARPSEPTSAAGGLTPPRSVTEVGVSTTLGRYAAGCAKANEPALRYAAAFALSRLAPAADPELSSAVVASLTPLVAERDAETAAMALRALNQWKHIGSEHVLLLEHQDWRVRVEAVRGLAADAASAKDRDLLAAWLMKEVRALSRKAVPPQALPRWHAVLVGVEALRAFATKSAPKALLQVLAHAPTNAGASSAASSGPSNGASAAPENAVLLRCTANAGLVRAGGTLAAVADCSDDELGDLMALDAVADGFGGNERGAFITNAAKSDVLRVRAAAAGAAVSLLSDARAAAVVRQALHAGEAVVVAAVADGFSKLTREAKAAKKPLPRQWLPELVRAAEREEVDADATASLREAVSAIDEKAADKLPSDDEAASQPASAPVVSADAIVCDVRTTKGAIVIELDVRRAPWSASAIANLAARGFYDGTPWHRVVADFVVQGGDPTGTGEGGPGFRLPTEAGTEPFSRGVLGVADAGKDTGGSQWFIMHTRAPHLEQRYTWLGRVVQGMDIVDRLQQDDRIVQMRPRR